MGDADWIKKGLRDRTWTAECHAIKPPALALSLKVDDLKFFLLTLLVDAMLREEFRGREEYAPPKDQPFSPTASPLEVERQKRKISLICSIANQLEKEHPTEHYRALALADRIEREHGAAFLTQRLPEAYEKKLQYAREAERNARKVAQPSPAPLPGGDPSRLRVKARKKATVQADGASGYPQGAFLDEELAAKYGLPSIIVFPPRARTMAEDDLKQLADNYLDALKRKQTGLGHPEYENFMFLEYDTRPGMYVTEGVAKAKGPQEPEGVAEKARGRPRSAATWTAATAEDTDGAVLRPRGGKGATERRDQLVADANRLCAALGTQPSDSGVAMLWYSGASRSTKKFVFQGHDFYNLLELLEALVPALRARAQEPRAAQDEPRAAEEPQTSQEEPQTSQEEEEGAFSLAPLEKLYGAGSKRARKDARGEDVPIVTDRRGCVYRVEHLYHDAAFDAIGQYEKCAALESECLAVVHKVGEKYNTPAVLSERPLSAAFLVPVKYPEHEPKKIAEASPCVLILWKDDILLLHVRAHMRERHIGRGVAQYLVWSIPSGEKRFVHAPACLTGSASKIWGCVGFLSSAQADPSATFSRGKDKARPPANVVALQLSFEKA